MNKPILRRGHEVTIVKVDSKLVKWAIALGFSISSHRDSFVDAYGPFRLNRDQINFVPCENLCGCQKKMYLGDDIVIDTNSNFKSKPRYVFCSVDCQRQNVLEVKRRTKDGASIGSFEEE